MRILFVCSGNSGDISPFVLDQVIALERLGIVSEYFIIQGRSFIGYLSNRYILIRKIDEFRPDIIHAHYGLSGVLARLQFKIPLVVTFHGDDLNRPLGRIFSILPIFFAQKRILVSNLMRSKIFGLPAEIIPCGVDLKTFFPVDQFLARRKMNLSPDKKYILFSSSFDRPEKNSALAQRAVDILRGRKMDLELLELKGYSREEVALLLNAVDVALLTSNREASPQFLKEAMAVNRAIVYTNVGDASLIVNNASGCYLCSYDPEDVALKLENVILNNQRTDGRARIKEYDSELIAFKIKCAYKSILKG